MSNVTKFPGAPAAAPDVMLEMQLAVQAAAVISAHFTRPRGESLDRIIAEIKVQVINYYNTIGIKEI